MLLLQAANQLTRYFCQFPTGAEAQAASHPLDAYHDLAIGKIKGQQLAGL